MKARPRCSVTFGHGRDEQRRVVRRDLRRFPNRGLGVPPVAVVDPDHIGEKQGVETPFLEQLGQLEPGFQPVELELASVGAAPQPVLNVRDTIHRECVQPQTPLRHLQPPAG